MTLRLDGLGRNKLLLLVTRVTSDEFCSVKYTYDWLPEKEQQHQQLSKKFRYFQLEVLLSRCCSVRSLLTGYN